MEKLENGFFTNFVFIVGGEKEIEKIHRFIEIVVNEQNSSKNYLIKMTIILLYIIRAIF